MTLEDVVQELIRCLGSEGDTTIAWEQVRKWPKGAIEAFQKAGWIIAANLAEWVECPGCTKNCFMRADVFPAQNGQRARALVACDQLDYMGKVNVPLARLQQWQLTQGQVARWICGTLSLKGKPEKDGATETFKLGNVQGKKRRGVLELNTDDTVCLKSSGHSMPLCEVVFIENDQPFIDRVGILAMVDLQPLTESPDYNQDKTNRQEEHSEKAAYERNKGNIVSPSKGSSLPGARSDQLAIFRSMTNLKFKEIKIRIDPEKLVLRISARDKEAAAPFSAIGITKKNEVTLNKQGEIFRAMANGPFNAGIRGAARAISRLSRSLREAFDTPDSPFHTNRPEFRLSIPKDNDAYQRAIKRTVAFDDTRKARGNMDAQAFLQNNDPNYNPEDFIYSDDPDLGAGD